MPVNSLNNIRIREYEDADAPSLLVLFHDTVHEINGQDYPPEQLEAWAPDRPDLQRWRAKFKNSKTIIAEADGIIVGFATLEQDRTSVGMLYVHKEYQRQGIATVLLRELERKLGKRGVQLVSVEASITAQKFFEHQGYRIKRENRKMLNGKEFVNFIMEKDLQPKDLKPMKEKINKRKGIKWGELLINKLFDLLMVIIGVTIAFQLNNLKLDSDRKSLERFYYESLLSDLDKDGEEFAHILKELKNDRARVSGFLQIKDPVPSADSLGSAISNVLSFETFSGNENTYLTLITGNGLSALNDRKIRAEITEYYTHYTSIRRFETVYTNLIFQLYNYFSPFSDFETKQLIDRTITSRPQTRNHILVTLSQLDQGIDDYEESVTLANRLKVAIKDQLK